MIKTEYTWVVSFGFDIYWIRPDRTPGLPSRQTLERVHGWVVLWGHSSKILTLSLLEKIELTQRHMITNWTHDHYKECSKTVFTRAIQKEPY